MMFPTTMWLGDVSSAHIFENPEKTKKHGFIGMNPNTLMTVLEELCDEIARNGFTKILLCTSHGGNSNLVGFFTRSQFYKKKNYVTMWTFAYNYNSLKPARLLEKINRDRSEFLMLTDADYSTLEAWAKTGTGGGHADFRETALVYGTYPELVCPSRFKDEKYGLTGSRLGFLSEHGVNCTLLRWFANNPGCFGAFAPEGCSETIGRAVVKTCVDRLREIFGCIKKNKECLEVLEEIKKL
jgi:creatinine amidohydrolase/Fe(II)-dependent formamide hydrolase-like protein